MNYTIAAHPTMYNGVQFRSRLEAKWAAFFDEMHWEWEYEPLDLGKWSPDFLIKGEHSALVEVKPIDKPDFDVMEKIHSAIFRTSHYTALLVGFGPWMNEEKERTCEYIGWSCCSLTSNVWKEAEFLLGKFCSLNSIWHPNDHDLSDFGGPRLWARDAWRRACNKVQWQVRHRR